MQEDEHNTFARDLQNLTQQNLQGPLTLTGGPDVCLPSSAFAFFAAGAFTGVALRLAADLGSAASISLDSSVQSTSSTSPSSYLTCTPDPAEGVQTEERLAAKRGASGPRVKRLWLLPSKRKVEVDDASKWTRNWYGITFPLTRKGVENPPATVNKGLSDLCPKSTPLSLKQRAVFACSLKQRRSVHATPP